jgi:arylsulfatase A-like enzyme
LLPVPLVLFPRIYSLAWLVAALGVGTIVVAFFERHPGVIWRLVWISFPPFLLTVAAIGASPLVGDLIKRSREKNRALPPAGSPNVMLIVLDTVAAGHLSLHGYDRATSTTLLELANHGTMFERACASSSWTLPSHATMFTGRWLHELSVGWLTPLDNRFPTLAEFLSGQGYATAGFVANAPYCGSDSGLGRGFTRYEDDSFPGLTALKTAVLVDRVLTGVQASTEFLEDWLELEEWRPSVDRFLGVFLSDRKTAAVVNREMLDWLARRPEPERPFFAFLNYYDAHYPYLLPVGKWHRFGGAPTDNGQFRMLQSWNDLNKTLLPARDLAFAVTAYDECVADLDEQIGKLIDRLRQRGVLDRTWLFIVSDHGESFGEHRGVFGHGTSLYQTELHVPLVVVPPGGSPTKHVVKDTVSLRDLAATVVDLTGLRAGSPFPGSSLARFWNEASGPGEPQPPSSSQALAEVVPAAAPTRDAMAAAKKAWPLGALNDGAWSYIRQDGDLREELFRVRDDAKQERDLARDPAERSRLELMRKTLDGLTGGPLVPERFSR